MGDYLELQSKPIISPVKIISLVNEFLLGQNYSSVIVYSDSTVEAKNELVKAGANFNFSVSDARTHQLIRECVEADFFVGTNSKISLWIVNLRRSRGMGSTSFIDGFDDFLFNP
jgi:hypothetical protein